MSWSVAAIGKAEAVRKSIADQFSSSGVCAEPEETVRKAAAAMIDAALAAQDPTVAVRVSASGSMSYRNWSGKSGVSNQMTIQIDPQYGFVE
jgi:hypothetical protein